MALFVRSFLCFRKFIAFGGQHVVHMHRFLVENRASRGPVTVDQPHGRIYWYRAVMRPNLKLVTILEAHHGIIGIAELAACFRVKTARSVSHRWAADSTSASST